MALNWIDVTDLPFNVILLLERAQMCWFPGWLPEPELGTALEANPVVEWYLCNKCPELQEWVDQVKAQADPNACAEDIRQAEMDVMNAINDLLVYVVDPLFMIGYLSWAGTHMNSQIS